MNDVNRFFVSFRMGPAVSLTYLMGGALPTSIAGYTPNSNFAGSSWSAKTAAVVELTTEVNDIMQGLSTFNSFFINYIRLHIPNGESSPTTQPKLSLAAITIIQGNATGRQKIKSVPVVQMYNPELEQDRIFEFEVNALFDQYSSIFLETPSLINNWLDTTSIPLGKMEVVLKGRHEKNQFTVANESIK